MIRLCEKNWLPSQSEDSVSCVTIYMALYVDSLGKNHRLTMPWSTHDNSMSIERNAAHRRVQGKGEWLDFDLVKRYRAGVHAYKRKRQMHCRHCSNVPPHACSLLYFLLPLCLASTMQFSSFISDSICNNIFISSIEISFQLSHKLISGLQYWELIGNHDK